MKKIIVTGANRGLGLEIVKGLKDCHIILAVRDVNRGYEVIKHLEGSFDVLSLDLTSEKSIESFVEVILSKYGRVDVLVNNAGIYNNAYGVIDFMGHSFDRVWVTNTLGPYILSKKLLNHVACIVFMNSIAGHGISLNMESIKGNLPTKSYAQSKYGCVLLSRYFMDYVKVVGTHPGYSKTDIFEGRKAGSMKDVLRFSTRLLAQPPSMGAQGALEAILGSHPSGTYLVPKYGMQLYGSPKAVLLKDYYRESDYEVFKSFIEHLY